MKYIVANIFQVSLAAGEQSRDRRASESRRDGLGLNRGQGSWKNRPMH